jgi:hypothetical protein
MDVTSLRGHSLAFDLAIKGLERDLVKDAEAVKLVREDLEEAALQLPESPSQPICGVRDACFHMIPITLALKARRCVREVARAEFGVDFHKPYDPETGEPGHEVEFDLLTVFGSDEEPVRLARMDVFYDALQFLDSDSLDALVTRIGAENAQARLDRRKAAQRSEQHALIDEIRREVGDMLKQVALACQEELRDKLPAELGETAGWLSPRDLADKFKVDYESLRARLRRWRKNHATGWMEVSASERGPRDPHVLYRLDAVKPIIDDTSKR